MGSCYCVGPQRGEPFCPCEMQRRGIVNKNGRWVEPEKDHGEATILHNYDCTCRPCMEKKYGECF